MAHLDPSAYAHRPAHSPPTGIEMPQGLIEALYDIVGRDAVRCGTDALARWSRSTLPQNTVPMAIVAPTTTEQVQQVMAVANRFRVALYPISAGKNWGYGDACAVGDGQIIVDLSQMNRIVAVDAELGIVTIEPGVTQGQLETYLRQHRLPWWVDATGAGADVSIVGNTVERGFGHTPNGDRFQHSCGMDVVLPDGRLLRTGFGHYADSRVAGTYKWGVGPYLDGLFTQSGMGIVTRMHLWLLPRPAKFRAFFFAVRRQEHLASLIDALRQLRLQGTLNTAVHVFNDMRMIAGSQRYPWDALDGRTPVPDHMRRALRKKHGIGAWSGSGALYGSREEVAAATRVVKRALRKIKGVQLLLFVDDRRWAALRRVRGLLSRFGVASSLVQRLNKLEQGYFLLKGDTSRLDFRSGLWRTRGNVHDPRGSSYDPLDYNAGFIWLSPVVPMRGADIERLMATLQPIFARHGFDLELTLSAITARAMCAVTTISYNRDDADETERARDCHDEALAAVIDAGYPPYRCGTLSMQCLDRKSSVFWDVAAQIKQAIDKNGVLSPGRYDPQRARQLDDNRRASPSMLAPVDTLTVFPTAIDPCCRPGAMAQRSG